MDCCLLLVLPCSCESPRHAVCTNHAVLACCCSVDPPGSPRPSSVFHFWWTPRVLFVRGQCTDAVKKDNISRPSEVLHRSQPVAQLDQCGPLWKWIHASLMARSKRGHPPRYLGHPCTEALSSISHESRHQSPQLRGDDIRSPLWNTPTSTECGFGQVFWRESFGATFVLVRPSTSMWASMPKKRTSWAWAGVQTTRRACGEQGGQPKSAQKKLLIEPSLSLSY